MEKISSNCMHLGLRVKDYQAAMDFYQGALGFEEIFTMHKRDFYQIMQATADGSAIEKKDDDDEVWLTYLRIKDEQYLEIFPVPGEEVAQFVDRQSFFHFSLQVDDINVAVARMKERGITVYNLHIDALNSHPAPDPFVPVLALCGSLIAWIKDPDGNLIEVMELTSNSRQRLRDTNRG
jgi:catechol 2,3-dioxygenase-like lactoylglutathione lyase family enzyme